MREGRAGTWLCEFLDPCASGLAPPRNLTEPGSPLRMGSTYEKFSSGGAGDLTFTQVGRVPPQLCARMQGGRSDSSLMVVRIERPSAAAFSPGRLRLSSRCRTPSATPFWFGLRLVRDVRDGLRLRTDVSALVPGDRFLLLLLTTPGHLSLIYNLRTDVSGAQKKPLAAPNSRAITLSKRMRASNQRHIFDLSSSSPSSLLFTLLVLRILLKAFFEKTTWMLDFQGKVSSALQRRYQICPGFLFGGRGSSVAFSVWQTR